MMDNKTAVMWLAEQLKKHRRPEYLQISWEKLDKLVQRAIKIEQRERVEIFRGGNEVVRMATQLIRKKRNNE